MICSLLKYKPEGFLLIGEAGLTKARKVNFKLAGRELWQLMRKVVSKGLYLHYSLLHSIVGKLPKGWLEGEVAFIF